MAQGDPTAILIPFTPLGSWSPFLLLMGQPSPLQTITHLSTTQVMLGPGFRLLGHPQR